HARNAAGRRRRRVARRWRAPAQAARQPFGDASAASGAAPPAWRACHPERLARRPRPAALRFQPSAPVEPRRHRGDRGRGQCADPCQCRRAYPAAQSRERRRRGRARAVRRKYGEEVRVVAMGSGIGTDRSEVPPYSVELCGGTHVRRTGDIGLFKIGGESSVASGVRRIEALTGAAAEAFLAGEENLLRQSAAVLRTSPSDLPARLARLVDDNRRLERELTEARRALAMGG